MTISLGVKKDNLREWGILEEWRSYQEDRRGWLGQVKSGTRHGSLRAVQDVRLGCIKGQNTRQSKTVPMNLQGS